MSDPTQPGWGQPPSQGPPPGQPGYGPPGGVQPPQWGGQQPPQGGPPSYGTPPGQGYSTPPGQAYGTPPGQGYGGPQGQGYGGPTPGFGQPGQQPYGAPPPSSGGNRGVIIAVVVVAVLVIGGGVAAFLLSGGDEGDEQEVTTSSSELNEAVDDLSSEVEDAFSDLATPPDAQTESGAEATEDAAAQEQEESVFNLEVGDCFNSGSTSEEVEQVGVVPCDTVHDSEVFHLVDYPDDGSGFPGLEALNEFADDECQGQAFSDYVGVQWADSRYFTSQLTPTEASWEQGDREIVCLLYDPTTPLESSVRGSAQ